MTGVRPGVLMVTGAYYPELSGAGLQCRSLIAALRDRVDFAVLTTTTDRQLPVRGTEDGIPVRRVFVNPSSLVSKALALVRTLDAFRDLSSRTQIVHLHGFSQKSIVLVLLAKLTRRKVAIKLTSFGDDDPQSIARRGWLTAWVFRRADAFIAVSPRFRESYEAVRLPSARFQTIPNGVDLARFHPPAEGERAALRQALGLPLDGSLTLFVGFFSREKQPDVLFDAWSRSAARADPAATLVFVGATRATYHEIDPALADQIRSRATAAGVADRVRFVESTLEIERFHRAADIFVLPSLREGMPNALVEAMASGAACVATRLPGITDRLVDHERTGLLVDVGKTSELERALHAVMIDPALRHRLGTAARHEAEARFGIEATARAHFDTYRALVGDASCAA